jgi:hypothetical protein
MYLSVIRVSAWFQVVVDPARHGLGQSRGSNEPEQQDCECLLRRHLFSSAVEEFFFGKNQDCAFLWPLLVTTRKWLMLIPLSSCKRLNNG